MKSTLIFEAVSDTPCSDVGSPRIRTRLKKQDGQVIFLELQGIKKFAANGQIKKNLPGEMQSQPYQVVGEVKQAKHVGGSSDGLQLVDGENRLFFDYTQRGILGTINKLLDTNYTTIELDKLIRVQDSQACFC